MSDIPPTLGPMTPGEFAEAAGVSRETLERLAAYAALLRRWSKAMNLVSASTLNDLWTRHMLDSAQVLPLAPEGARDWVDLGSGAGFPGLVVAILAHESAPDLRVTLVESDRRKSAFLMEAARAAGVSVTVKAERLETLPDACADVVSARALAPLKELLPWSARLLRPGGAALLSKGRQWREELDAAAGVWPCAPEPFPSRVDSESVILRFRTGGPA